MNHILFVASSIGINLSLISSKDFPFVSGIKKYRNMLAAIATAANSQNVPCGPATSSRRWKVLTRTKTAMTVRPVARPASTLYSGGSSSPTNTHCRGPTPAQIRETAHFVKLRRGSGKDRQGMAP